MFDKLLTVWSTFDEYIVSWWLIRLHPVADSLLNYCQHYAVGTLFSPQQGLDNPMTCGLSVRIRGRSTTQVDVIVNVVLFIVIFVQFWPTTVSFNCLCFLCNHIPTDFFYFIFNYTLIGSILARFFKTFCIYWFIFSRFLYFTPKGF